MPKLLDRIMRAGEGKILRDLSKVVDKVNSFEDSISPLSDDALRAKTDEFLHRLRRRRHPVLAAGPLAQDRDRCCRPHPRIRR